jgi:hypothetical protein
MENFNWDPALSKLLSALEANRASIPSCSDEEFNFLSEFLQSRELNALVQVYNKILRNLKDEKFSPILSNAMEINVEVLGMLSTKTHASEEFKELFQLLQKPHVQALLIAHDTVAQKDYYPRLPDIPVEVDEDEETVKIVQLVKSDEPLSGAGIEPIMVSFIKAPRLTPSKSWFWFFSQYFYFTAEIKFAININAHYLYLSSYV